MWQYIILINIDWIELTQLTFHNEFLRMLSCWPIENSVMCITSKGCDILLHKMETAG